MATTYELARAARGRLDFLNEQVRLLREEDARYGQERDRVDELRRKNRLELASYLLGEVSDDEVRALEQRLSYPSLLPIKRGFEDQLRQSQADLAQLLLDPDAAHNDLYQRQLQDEQDEIREVYERLRAQVDLWRANAHFQGLHQRGFFEPRYRAGLFGWLRDWRAVSLLMAALEKLQPGARYPTPAALRDTWTTLWGEAQPILELWDNQEARRQHLLQLAARRAELEQAPTRLFQAMYAALGDAINDHLEALPNDTRVELAAQDKHLVIFLQKSAGLQKQLQYLGEIRERRLRPLLQKTEQDASRLRQKIYKLERKYKYVSDADITKMHTFKQESWQKRHTRFSSMRERLGGFNKYQKGSFTEDYLWWDLMTGGAPGDDIYEVRVFRMNHPRFNHRTYESPWHHHHHTVHHTVHHDHHGDASSLAAALAMDEAADALADALGSGGGDELAFGDAS